VFKNKMLRKIFADRRHKGNGDFKVRSLIIYVGYRVLLDSLIQEVTVDQTHNSM
jgi:hypothetical protein